MLKLCYHYFFIFHMLLVNFELFRIFDRNILVSNNIFCTDCLLLNLLCHFREFLLLLYAFPNRTRLKIILPPHFSFCLKIWEDLFLFILIFRSFIQLVCNFEVPFQFSFFMFQPWVYWPLLKIHLLTYFFDCHGCTIFLTSIPLIQA